MNEKTFVLELEKLGIVLNSKQLWQLNRYFELLTEWNKKINLTRIVLKEDVYLKHFYDSITLCKAIDLCKNISLCDVGTGAGFPGIVLKIVFPTLSVTLIDSLLKRINFLNVVIKELELTDIIAIHTRCEDYAKYHGSSFDVVTSRAVTNLNDLIKMSVGLCKNGGYLIPMKANCDEELKNALTTLKKANIELIKKIEFELPIENSHRTLLVMKKNKKAKKSLKK